MSTVPTRLPAAFSAGLTVEFSVAAPDYSPADGWRLRLVLAGPSVLDAPFEGTFDESTGRWLFTLASEITARLSPGLYRWSLRASRGLEPLIELGAVSWTDGVPLALGLEDLASVGEVRTAIGDVLLVEDTDYEIDLDAGTLTPETGGLLTDFATNGALEVADVKWLPSVYVRPLDQGLVTVALDLFEAEAGAALSFHERMLPILYAAFEGRIPKGLESFQIFNRTVSLIPIEKLAAMIVEFENIVRLRKAAGRNRWGRQIRVRFTGASNERP